jgi:DNA-binding transcriptional ArsR family regulator
MNQIFKAISDPTRRQVLALLRNGPQSAGELADHFDVSKPTMSSHFAILREADLITSSKQGKSIVYSLKLSVLEDALLGFAQLLGSQAAAPNTKDAPANPPSPINKGKS